jgi:hypothetical protein
MKSLVKLNVYLTVIVYGLITNLIQMNANFFRLDAQDMTYLINHKPHTDRQTLLIHQKTMVFALTLRPKAETQQLELLVKAILRKLIAQLTLTVTSIL